MDALSYALERFPDVWVCSDEIYDRLIYGDQGTRAWASLDWRGGRDRSDHVQLSVGGVCDDRLAHRLHRRAEEADRRDGQTPGPDDVQRLRGFLFPAIVEAYTNPQSDAENRKRCAGIPNAAANTCGNASTPSPACSACSPHRRVYCFPNIAAHLNKPLSAGNKKPPKPSPFPPWSSKKLT